MHKFEAKMTQAFEKYTSEGQATRDLGLMSFMMNSLADKHKFDVILVDLSPSNSALNQVVAISCDYILPPANPSIYSCGSVHGLLTSVLTGEEGWLKKHEAIVDYQKKKVKKREADDDIMEWLLPASPPKMLPILVNNYSLDTYKGKEYMHLAESQFVYTMMKYVHEGASCQPRPRAPWPPLALTTAPPPRRMSVHRGQREGAGGRLGRQESEDRGQSRK
jgi:cellulose biosynthesis protein BcsQ